MDEILEKMKKESISMLVLFVMIIIILKILFYKESFMVVLKTAVTLIWLFVLPGFILLYHYHNKLDFTERLVIAIPLNAALIGISSYYAGLLGLHVKYHGLILPVLIILIGILLLKFVQSKNKDNEQSKADSNGNLQ